MHQLNKRDILPHVLVSIVCIVILVAPAGALSVTNGAMITTPGGATSPVITITDFPFAQNDTLTIDLSDMKWFLVNFSFNNDNVVIHSNASSAVWTKTLSTDGNTLTLTSSNGPTALNEIVTVTFRGTAGNPWGDSDWLKSIPVKVTRTGNHTDDFFTFDINTTIPQQGLHINDGATITTPYGSTSPVITITDSPIAQNGSITIDVSYLRLLVASNTFTDANVMISSNASFAVWTKSVSADGNTLTLTTTHGPTQMNETITVTFTGAGGNPWLARSGPQNPILTATRSDGKGVRDFTFRIETLPISDPVADFSASPTLDIAPLTILFTDTSLGSPISWNWNFGDGETSTSQNPSHTYTKAGTYTVSLIATYAPEGEKTKTRTNYITVLNGAIRQANTSVTGLTLTNCGGMQTITIDTSVLPAALSPNNSVLEIQPPADRGLKNITLSALNGVGFSRNGNLIVGNLTGVHLVSEEIRPPHGFSDTTGSLSSFNYSIDLSSYPCNAVLSTKIWEGVIPVYDTKFRQLASGNQPPAFPVGTAYTAKITRTNFPSSAPVKIHMSVNSSWNGLLGGGPGKIFIWRIADDENSGQILPTDYRYSDVIHNLDFYEADSPSGMSTFGISSLTGSNNPFQLVIFTIQQAVSAPGSSPGSGDADTSASNTGAVAGKATGPVTVQTANTQKAPAPVDPGKTEKIYTNAQGMITQATLLESTDQLARISFDRGVVAQDRTGAPLTSVSITSVTADRLPSAPTSAGSTFTGMAYTVEPDGATFSPAVPFSLLYPQAQWAEEYFVKTFDTQSGSWVDIPTIHDASTGRITANVSHFCTIALFAQPIVSAHPSPPKSTPVQMLAPAATPPPPPGTALNIFIGMMTWVTGLVLNNVYLVVIVVVLGIAYYVKTRKSPGSGL